MTRFSGFGNPKGMASSLDEGVIAEMRTMLDGRHDSLRKRADMASAFIFVGRRRVYREEAGWRALRHDFPDEYDEAKRRVENEEDDRTDWAEPEEALRERISEEQEWRS